MRTSVRGLARRGSETFGRGNPRRELRRWEIRDVSGSFFKGKSRRKSFLYGLQIVSLPNVFPLSRPFLSSKIIVARWCHPVGRSNLFRRFLAPNFQQISRPSEIINIHTLVCQFRARAFCLVKHFILPFSPIGTVTFSISLL